MAKMFPKIFPGYKNKKSNAEYQIYDKLECLSDNYYVFYSKYATGIFNSEAECEIDFIVFNGTDVAICIEAKGYKFGYGVKKYSERYLCQIGYEKKDIIEQAKKSTNAFINFLKADSHIPLRKTAYVNWALCFPNDKFTFDIPWFKGLTEEQIIDKEKFGDLPNAIRSMEDLIRDNPDSNSEIEADEFVKKVNRSLSFIRTLDIIWKDQEEQINHATDDQLEALNDLLLNSKMLINGAAGTGKSTIAVKFAEMLSDNDKKVLFLINHNTASARTSRFKDKKVKVSTLSEIKQCGDKYDAIIVEDGHEYSLEQLKGIALFLKSDEDSNYAIFLDNNRDNNKPKHWEDKTIKNHYARKSLIKNCRNSRSIVDYLNMIYGTKMIYSTHVPTGDKVNEIKISSIHDEYDKISYHIKILLDEKITPGKIVILLNSPKEESFLGTDDKLCGKELISVKAGYDETNENCIYYSNTDEFSGMDAEVIMISLGPSLKEKEQIAKAIYDQGSRARLRLYIYLHESQLKTLHSSQH